MAIGVLYSDDLTYLDVSRPLCLNGFINFTCGFHLNYPTKTTDKAHTTDIPHQHITNPISFRIVWVTATDL